MTETGAKSRWRRVRRYLLWALVGVLLLFGGLAWYATTDSFQAMVRRRLVTELERITGGRVELGGFHTIPFRFRVDVRDLTIHGLEQPTDVPYAHVDRLVAQVKIISVLGAEFGFSQVVLERPVIHIIVYPDGRTNQPQPQVARTSAKNPVEQLFSMSINRLEVRHGELLWNDQKIPLDFTANDISADMTYSLLHRHYTCNLLLGKVDTTLQNYRPVAWTAEAHFVLGQDNVEIQSLKATSGRSHLQVSGRVKNFRDPKFEGTYDLSVDLTELAAVTHRREMRHGVFTGNGRGTWSMQDFSSQGKVLINDLDWRDESFSLANASLSAQFSVDPHRLTLTQIQSHLLGGSVSGDADITNWLSTPPAKAAKGKPPAEQQKGTVRLRIKDVLIASAAAALSTRSLPLERMNLAGATSGTVAAQWKGAPRNVEAEVALDVVPPLRIARGQIPLTARARATYRGAPGELQVAEFSAATRATQVQASGTLSSTAALKLSMTTTDVGEWQPILAALGAAERIPLALHGHASFNGAATGKLSDAIIAGNLQVQDFDSVLPATTRVPERQVHWDSLVTDLQVSQHSFAARNGRLRHGEAAIHFDLSASLQHGRFTGSSPFTSRVNVRNADAAELLALAGYDYPLTGTLDLHLQASGTWAEPHGEGRVLLTKATIYQEPVERFYSDLRFTGSEAELNNIQLTYHEARVSGGATYDSSTHAFHFNLTGSDFDLLRIPPLQASRVKVEGRMDFTAVGSGTLEEPVINATAHLRDLTLDHERAGDFTIDAVTQGADLRLTGHSQFEHAELSIDGNIHLRGDWPSSVNLHFNHLDVDPLLRTYLQGRVTGHSAVAGVLQLQGPLRMPRELNIAGNLSDFYATSKTSRFTTTALCASRFPVNC